MCILLNNTQFPGDGELHSWPCRLISLRSGIWTEKMIGVQILHLCPASPHQRPNIDRCIKRWLLTTVRHYSPLFATVPHYSPLFPTIRTIRTIRDYSLFATIRYSLLRFFRHPLYALQSFWNQSIKIGCQTPRPFQLVWEKWKTWA